MQDQNSSGLTYVVSEKSSFLVISFTGPLIWGNENVVKKCQDEIAQRRCDRIVLDLRNVGAVNVAAIPEFVKLQASARQKGRLRLCGLRNDVGRLLLEKGAVREQELREDLKTALKSLGPAEAP